MKYNKQKELRQDEEANFFARCLLMPRPLVKEELEKLKKTKILDHQDLITRLAKKFNVEYNLMNFRLIELELIDVGLGTIIK